MSNYIDSWKIITNKSTEENQIEYNWENGKTFCCLCGNEYSIVAFGETYVDAEGFNYDIQICLNCIEKLYDLTKER